MSNTLGEFVQKKRHEMGLSLRDFGKLCDISHTHVDSIEKGVDFRTGKKVNITNETIKRLASVLGVDSVYLFSLCDEEIEPIYFRFAKTAKEIGATEEDIEKALDFLSYAKNRENKNND